MHNTLKAILEQKEKEVSFLKQQMRIKEDFSHKTPISFKKALQGNSLAVIAEIKRRSPSKGLIDPIENPLQLAENYIQGGANALSILTDQTFFGGSLEILEQIASVAQEQSIPSLRKDFIIDPIQILEAKQAGASAVLLIVAALGSKTKALLDFARSCQLDVLVEVHSVEELDIALEAEADIIGVNNRNLDTFEVDTDLALKLLPLIPDGVITVAESGIQDPSLAKRYHQAGFHAVLIGESLVRSPSPKQFIQACKYG
jgi:indole-3-glycerol phosphate synthase